MSYRMRSLCNGILFIAMIIINYLSNALPFNGVTQKELSAMYDIFLTPAGYVFSIWGIIYIGLSMYVLSQALPKRLNDSRLRSLDLPFALSCLFNMMWLFVWHYRFVTLSVFMMLGLLASLICCYIRLDKGRRQQDQASYWGVEHTFSIYLGWVCLATVLNIATWFYTYGWTGTPWSPQTWTVILLVLIMILFIYIGGSRRDTAIFGVLVWASIGILIKNKAEYMIWLTCCFVIGISVCALAWTVISKRSTHMNS